MIRNMTNLSEVLHELQTALSDAEKAEYNLEQARAKLSPLEEAAKEKRNAVEVLMRQYQSLTGATVPASRSRRSDPNAPKRTYNVTNESKIAATEKRQYTRAINAGKSEAEAKKAGKEAAKALAQKLGMK
jgi:hypothetical protein